MDDASSSYDDDRRSRAGLWLLGGGMSGSGPAAALLGLGALLPVGLLLVAVGLVLDYRPVSWVGGLLAAAGTVVLALRLDAMHRRVNRSNALLSGALEGVSAGQLVCDGDDRPAFANGMFRNLTGWSGGTPPLEALEGQFSGDPDSLAEFRRLLDRVRSGGSAAAELMIPRGDLPPEWRRVRARPIDGFPGAIHWRIEDITARREMASVVDHEQATIVDFMDHAPIGFFSVDREGGFRFVNATLAGWLGCQPYDLMSSELALHDVLAHPPSGAAPYDLFQGAGAEQRGELTMRRRDGSVFQASVAQTVVQEEDGSVYTRAIVRDLTPEREWEKALSISEQRFQRFFEDAPIGIALVDEAGLLVECNAAFATLIGSDAKAVAGRPVTDLLLPEERAMVAERLQAVLGGADPAAPLEVRLSDGRELVAQLYARRLNAVGSEGGAGLILHFIDLTERKSLEAQFAQSQKMQAVGQLAGGVAHDFNNLLTAMIGFCDLLLLRHKPGDQSFSDIMQIKQNANRAANLVRQLLAFSRQQTLQPRIISVTDVLAELASLMRRLIGENIELKMIHGRELGLVKVDQNQLEQVIINLVVNARDAMPGGGRLTIVTSNHQIERAERREHETVPTGDYVAVEVIDTGTGIPKENLQRIFEPFFSTKEVGAGTGLGLSTVYGIVRQTGGFVFVDSEPGEGAKFTILLPRHQGQPKTVEAEPRERRGSDLTGTGTIMLVEDEDAVRVFSARALRNKGYHVLEARNGEAALQQLGPEGGDGVDLLITDVVMPQMDGPTLARHVREKRPDMKVIFISGYAEDRLGEIDGVEVAHFLPKPFSLKQLATKVKEVMRGA